jgi:uncharacterized protein YecE (DUF72 family)
MAIRLGCSGWSYDHWREPVYAGAPPRTWLSQYARRFDTVEINSTFYRLPRRSAVAGWADQTPDGFCFAVKVSRYLTHIRRLNEIERGIELLLDRVQPLVDAGKLGPLLWQLPGNFARDDDRLARALAAVPHDLRHCIEFRHPSWFGDGRAARPRRRARRGGPSRTAVPDRRANSGLVVRPVPLRPSRAARQLLRP